MVAYTQIKWARVLYFLGLRKGTGDNIENIYSQEISADSSYLFSLLIMFCYENSNADSFEASTTSSCSSPN